MKNPLLLFGTTFLFVLCILPANAAVYQAEEELSISVPVEDDLYVAGGTVSVNEDVEGDMYLVGGEARIGSEILHDLVVFSGDVFLDGDVHGDARIVGGDVRIDSTIDEDLIVVAGRVEITNEAVIQGELTVYGGDVVLRGLVREDVYIRGGRVVVTGAINGKTDIRAEELHFSGNANDSAVLVAKKFVVADDASFGRELRYWRPEGPYEFGSSFQLGEPLYDEELAITKVDDMGHAAQKGMKLKIFTLFGYSFFSSAFIIALLVLLTYTYFEQLAKRLQENLGMSFLYGLLFVIVTPVVAFLFCLTLIGVPIGLIVAMTYVCTIILAKPFASVCIANYLNVKKSYTWGKLTIFFVSLAAYLILKILGHIPYIGWVFVMIPVLMSFGAAMVVEWGWWKKLR